MTPEQARAVLKEHNLPDNFCVLPFLGLECKTTGEASACCVQQESAVNEFGQPYNFARNDIVEVFTSRWMRNLRQDFLNNEQVKSCYNCWDEEKAGLTSKRMRELIRFADKIDEVVESPRIYYLDLKFGNICNLKCRICTSFASSKWAEEELKLGIAQAGQPERMIQMGKWPKENQQFWECLYNISGPTQVMEFFGGEPLLLKEHKSFLEHLVSTGKANNKLISYNTNGTQDMRQFYDAWSKFDRVQVFFSIDGVGDRFTYLRHPAPWDQVNNNIRHLLEHGPKNVSVNFFCSVSAFNAYYLEEVAAWAEQYPQCQLHWNMVYVPNHYSARCLPQAAKQAIEQRLMSSKYKDQFASIVNYINDQDQTQWYPQFLDWLAKLDQSRSESYAKTFPEFNEVLNGLV